MIPDCIYCHQPMLLEKTLGTKKAYKGKRYVCSICEYVETVFGTQGPDAIMIMEEKDKYKPKVEEIVVHPNYDLEETTE